MYILFIFFTSQFWFKSCRCKIKILLEWLLFNWCRLIFLIIYIYIYIILKYFIQRRKLIFNKFELIYLNKTFKNETIWNDMNSNSMYLHVLKLENHVFKHKVKFGFNGRCYWNWYFGLAKDLWGSYASRTLVLDKDNLFITYINRILFKWVNNISMKYMIFMRIYI